MCRNWLSVIVHERGGWGGSDEPTVADVTYLRDGATMLAGVYAIQPAGFVVVPALRELPPVKAHSDVGSLTPEFADGLLEVLRLELANRVAAYRARFGSLEVEPGADEEWVRRDHLAWEALAQDPSQFRVSRWGAAEEHGPLLTSEWHQGEPYSELCPIGSQGWPCPTGCAATAVAQIMRYHEWPPNGLEEISYWWDGDDSCGDPTPPGRELFADLRNPYAWESMPDRCERDGPPEERAALAELCYEIGVAAFMDYGDCNSATTTSSVATALVERFGYHRVLQFLNRAGRTRTEWFSILRDEIDAGRPVYYDILSHAGVVDGWRDDGGLLQIHFNYGWGGPQNAWYGLDEIPGSPGVDFESMLRRIMPANQNPFIVYPDRSGGFATVQDAVNAALDGDVIELADGVFRGPGNRDVVTSNHIITIRSRNGNPARCILDVEGTPDELHRGFILNHHGLLLEKITIRGGYAASAAGVRSGVATS
ncbi:MAG: C10 family peptidase [Candidatus Eisenbacteria bacterium]